MKHLWVLSLLLLHPSAIHSKVKCPGKDKCLCLPGPEFEFHCPPNYGDDGGFVMHYNEERNNILIDCYSPGDEFDISQLPNITIPTVNMFSIRFCPLPPNNFKEILDELGVVDVKYLRFGSTDLDLFLNESYFEGLDKLQNLTIEKNKFLDLEENVFVNTPNLIDVELTGSELKLKPNLFRSTPLLRSLDISQNHLEAIPNGLFLPLNNLERLYLWENNLTIIDEWVFEGLSNLKSLELSVNNIETITTDAFRNLTQLIQVGLSKNRLGQIPSKLFEANTLLKLVRLNGNFNLQLPDYLLSNLTQLEEVGFTNCRLVSIPEHIFENSSNLKTLMLAENQLTDLSPDLFKGLVNLEAIYLHSNQIEDISHLFKSLKKLKKLHLHENLIKTIGRNAFEDLHDLEELTLQKNRISRIHHHAFRNLDKLLRITLQQNEIVGRLDSPLFENNAALENINLSYNRIVRVANIIRMANKRRLKRLDLSHNEIKFITLSSIYVQNSTKKVVIKLNNNNITTVYFDPVDINVDQKEVGYAELYLENNPIHCDCRNYDLLRYFRYETNLEDIHVLFDIKKDGVVCVSPPPLEDVSLNEVASHFMTCSLQQLARTQTHCPAECSCSWRPSDKTVIINCDGNNLTEFPKIVLPSPEVVGFNQTEVHLRNNSLVKGPEWSSNYDNVTKLFLSHNKIDRIEWLPPKLEVLHLDNNMLQSLDYAVLHTLNSTNLANLTLQNNPWLCQCSTRNLSQFLRQHVGQVDVNDIFCNNTTTRLSDLNIEDLCSNLLLVYLVTILLILLIATAVTVALYYRYQKEIKIWLFANNMCLWWVTEEDVDRDKTYDAFISYSHKDEDFVVQNLLPRLEGGPRHYQLCLHYRNWIPGEFIAKQVTNSVLESRRTIVVLSPNFLESVWGKLEFRTAHTQAMTEGRARVIIVFYGDVDINSLDDELKTYLKTNTYVKWGEPYFWNKLLYALPHSKRTVSNMNQKHANVMSCIDDKFKLVSPVTVSPGSTPPVLTLDVNLLKKHPLHFVASSEMDTPPAEAGLLTSTCL